MSNAYLKLSIIGLLLLLSGCMTDYPNRNPVGNMFPSVSGESLEGERVAMPEAFSSDKTLFLIGYVQNSQFDIDRWLIGLDMTQTDVAVYELPTIQGMFPKFFKTQINDGMRKGIPKALWKGVVTIYDDGERVQEFTGNINPNNARVLLINKRGEVIYFYDEGFSVEALKDLREVIAEE